MRIIEYVNAGTFFMGIFFLICTILYFIIADIPGAIRATKSDEAKSILESAKTRKQAAAIVKQFKQPAKADPMTVPAVKPKAKKEKKRKKKDAENNPDNSVIDLGDIDLSDILFPETEEKWPQMEVLQLYSREQKQILNELMQRFVPSERANGIRIYAGGEKIEFK